MGDRAGRLNLWEVTLVTVLIFAAAGVLLLCGMGVGWLSTEVHWLFAPVIMFVLVWLFVLYLNKGGSGGRL